MKLCDSIKGKLHLYPADSSVHAALHASSVYVAMWQFYVVKNRPCKKVALPVFYNTFKTLEPHSQTVSFNLATLFAVHNSATSWCSWFCDVTLQHVNVWCFCTVCFSEREKCCLQDVSPVLVNQQLNIRCISLLYCVSDTTSTTPTSSLASKSHCWYLRKRCSISFKMHSTETGRA